jgi:hypothetical protein
MNSVALTTYTTKSGSKKKREISELLCWNFTFKNEKKIFHMVGKNIMSLYLVGLFFLFFSCHGQSIPNGSYVFKQEFFDNNTTFTVPNGVYALSLLLIAGGGSGGASSLLAGGGGAGGGTIMATVMVTPNTIFDIRVGAGGLALPSDEDSLGNNGGNSTFNNTDIFLEAQGGQGGNMDIFDVEPAKG